MFKIPRTVLDGLVVFGLGGLGLLVYSQLVNSQPMTDSGEKLTFGEWVGRSPVSFKYLQSIGDGTGMILKDWDGKSYTISWLQKDCRSRLIEGEDITNKQNFFDKNLPVCKKDTIRYLTSEYKKYNPGGPVPKFLNTTSTTIVKTPQIQKNTTVTSQEQTISNNSVNPSTPPTTYRQPQSLREEMRQNESMKNSEEQICNSVKSGDYDWVLPTDWDGVNRGQMEESIFIKKRGNNLIVLKKRWGGFSDGSPPWFVCEDKKLGVNMSSPIKSIEGCDFNSYRNDYTKDIDKEEWIVDQGILYRYNQKLTISCTDKNVLNKYDIKETVYKSKSSSSVRPLSSRSGQTPRDYFNLIIP